MVFTYLETAIAFILVMLAASLMVNVVVRGYDTLTHARAKVVQAMLRQLYRGYFHQQKLAIPLGGENRFVHDVLSAPILHSETSYDALRDAKPDVDKLLDAASNKTDQKLAKVHSTVEYLLVDDLVAIIDDASETAVRGWFGVGASTGVVFAHQALSAYVRDWFTTAAATAANQFGKTARRKAMSVAAIAVVVLNLDAIRLAYDLYHDRAIDARIAQHVDDMTATAQRLIAPQTPGAPDGKDQLEADLQKTAALFSVERVPIGWNDSYISRRWCAYRGECNDPSIAVPTRSQLELDILYWLIGLFSSWLMLSLGAPFWVRALETLTGIKDKLKPPRGKSPGSNPWPDDPDDDASTTTVAATTTTTPHATTTTVAATTGPPPVVPPGHAPGPTVVVVEAGEKPDP